MIINTRTPLGGAVYPFLKRMGKKWLIHSWDVDDEKPAHYDAPIALRWINESQVNDLYIEDVTMEEFLDESGLNPQMMSGGFVLSKRLSRLMRPYFMYGFFDQSRIDICYLNQDARERKVWDGAGRVRRSVLLRVLEQLPDVRDCKRRELEHELRTTRRIEFTLMSAAGQDKGHAIVFDDDELEADFVLPRDTKEQVTLEDSSIFVGLYPVHHADTMRLDIQSLINLWGFFQHDDLITWLKQEGALFLESVRTGEVTPAMRRIDRTDTDDTDEALEAIQNWYVREYLASGGDPRWFGSIVKGLVNQHLKRINSSTLGRMRLPVPGGRYYVMTDEAGGMHVPAGHIKLDPVYSTAWINADDWVNFAADVWGGADQDDALWVFPFQDYDGSQQILAWRSPNQAGEYVLLKPTVDSHIPQWETVDRTLRFPVADSRHLPERIDRLRVSYLNLVDPDTAGGLGEWLSEYSIDAMRYTIQRAAQNRGSLGLYCNTLMLARALYNRLPAHPPASLEDVIDGSVKAGTNLEPVREWCFTACEKIIKQGKAIPTILHERLAVRNGEDSILLLPEKTRNHWLDRLIDAIEMHIQHIENERDVLMKETMPPLEVFRAGYQQSEFIRHGSRLNQIYTASLPWTSRRQPATIHIEEAFAVARERTDAHLERVSDGDPRVRQQILLAAAAYYYSNPAHSGSDESLWQTGAKTQDGTRQPGIAREMIQALRKIGVLDELNLLENGSVMRYPGAMQLLIPRPAIKIVGVWFNYWRFIAGQRGLPVPERMQQVDDHDHKWAKDRVKNLAQSKFRGIRLTIRRENGRAIAYTRQGNIFGYIAKEQTDIVSDEITLHVSRVRDGNYLSVYS